MKIIIAGSSGFIGRELIRSWLASGHHVKRLVRRTPIHQDEIFWDPSSQQLNTNDLESVDAIVNLCGENIADGKWTEERKLQLRKSRIEPAALLSKTVDSLSNPPSVVIHASAIGWYGDKKDILCTEESPKGQGFLAELTADWEAATYLRKAPSRLCQMRLGVVLGPEGGALQKMLLPFGLGLGGPLGNGEQYFSWIHRTDVIGAFSWALTSSDASGPINVVAPESVKQKEFANILGAVLHRPAKLPLPRFMIKMMMGEMGESLLLASTRVSPAKLLGSSFVFKYGDLKSALRDLCAG